MSLMATLMLFGREMFRIRAAESGSVPWRMVGASLCVRPPQMVLRQLIQSGGRTRVKVRYGLRAVPAWLCLLALYGQCRAEGYEWTLTRSQIYLPLGRSPLRVPVCLSFYRMSQPTKLAGCFYRAYLRAPMTLSWALKPSAPWQVCVQVTLLLRLVSFGRLCDCGTMKMPMPK